MQPQAQTLTKVSTFSGDLGETVRKYSSEFEETKFGFRKTSKYFLYQEEPSPNFILVSKHPDKVLIKRGYNLIFTVTSDFEDTNNQVAERFQETTGISLRKAPEDLSKYLDPQNEVLPIFKKDSLMAITILRSGRPFIEQ